MAEPRTSVLLAGTAGGVGTTTVTALLFEALSVDRSPVLFDHTGGDLGPRLTEGDEAALLDERLALHDLGPHAAGELVDRLADPRAFAVVVTATSPAGFAAARRVLTAIRTTHGAPGISRTLVAAVGVFGKHPTASASEALQNEFGRRSLVIIPRDAALAAGGRVPLNRISRESHRARQRLVGFLRERLDTRQS